MKKFALGLVFIFASSLVQAAWTEESYEKVDDRLSQLSVQEIAAACDDGVDSACNDLLAKLTPQGAYGYEFLTSDEFFAEARKHCPAQGSDVCVHLMKRIFSEVENDPKFDALKTKVIAQTATNCEALAASTKKSARCSQFFESIGDAYIPAAEARCRANISSCSAVLEFVPEMNRDAVLAAVCVDENLQTPACKGVLEAKLKAEAGMKEYEESKAKQTRSTLGMIGGFLGLIVFGVIFSTRCPSCKKFFAKEVVQTEHVGYEDEGLKTRSVQTGKATDIDGHTLATFHQNQTFQQIKENFKDHCRCRKCGHRWTTWRSKKHEKRVA